MSLSGSDRFRICNTRDGKGNKSKYLTAYHYEYTEGMLEPSLLYKQGQTVHRSETNRSRQIAYRTNKQTNIRKGRKIEKDSNITNNNSLTLIVLG